MTVTLNSDKTASVSEYTITKQAPPSRATCTVEPPTGQIAKGSAPWTGQCVHFFAAVFQFDTNTGPCDFLGNYSSTRENRSYNFEGGTVRVSADTTNCDLLTPVVEDSLVEVWALVQGDESYDTTIGGTNTYTVMQLVDIEVYQQP